MRDKIIAEIRRLAEANHGQPPGRQVFEAKTGIRQAEWYGVHWARWGDAVVEAGFSPNAIQTKLDSSTLLQRIGEAYRYFGRVATNGELRLYGRSRPEFPSHSTISNHFANKAILIEAIRGWASSRPEFHDVINLLPDGRKLPAIDRKIRTRDGSVYLIQSGPHYKIGRSNEIERRIKEIRIALPETAVLVHTITTDDPPGIEAYWHRRFANQRANGEWFRLTPSDVLAFKRRKFQ